MSFLLLALASALPAGLIQDTTIPVEAYLQLKGIDEVRTAPAGRAAVLTVTERDAPRDLPRRTLYLWDGRPGLRRLAPSLNDAWGPRWSPNAARVGFLSDGSAEGNSTHGGEPQVWIVDPSRTDAPVALPRLPGGVRDFAWVGDSMMIALAGPAGTGTATGATTSGRSASMWRVPVAGGPAELLWSGPETVFQLVVSSDRRSVVVVHGPPTATPDRPLETDLWLHTLDGGEPRRLTRRPGAEWLPTWAPDGTSVTFQAPQQPDHPNSQTELFSVSVSGGSPRPLTIAFDRTVLDHDWAPDGRLIFRAALGTQTHLFAIEAGGAIVPLTSGAFHHGAFSFVAADSSLVAVREGARDAQELWRVSGEAPIRLTDLNERLDRWTIPRQEVIRWTAPDGLVVEGLLVYPRGYSEGERYPLLVDPAGGPGRRVRNVLQQDRLYPLFATHGYAVLAVNFRGSTGYGESFATSNRRDLGGGDVPDIIAGIAHLSRMGIADPSRIGVLGEDYGLEIARLILSAGQRFRAAAILAADTHRAFGGETTNRDTAPILIAEASELEFDGFFRLLRWFDRFLKFDGADRVAFRLPGETSSGPGGWKLRVEGADPRTGIFTLQPGGNRFLAVRSAFHDPDSGAGDPVLELDLEEGIVLENFDDGEIAVAGAVTRFFGYPTLLLPLGTVAVNPAADRASAALTIDLAFPIADAGGEFLFRVGGFEPVRIFVPPASM